MEDKITDWLLKGGFPFEMKVSNMSIDVGFLVAPPLAQASHLYPF